MQDRQLNLPAEVSASEHVRVSETPRQWQRQTETQGEGQSRHKAGAEPKARNEKRGCGWVRAMGEEAMAGMDCVYMRGSVLMRWRCEMGGVLPSLAIQ
jgi:hypothetical protein